MKNKLIFMMFTVSSLLTVSCTNDDYDNGEIKATAPKNIKLIPDNGMEANCSDGDPSNPKPI